MRRVYAVLGLCAFVFFFSSFRYNTSQYYHLLNTKKSTVEFKKPSFALKQRRKVSLYSDYLNRLVQPEKEGLFRGVMMGMSKVAVKEIETATKVLDKDRELTYTVIFRYDENGIELADVTYLFDSHQKLTNIDVTYHLGSESVASKVYERYVSHFSQKYGICDVSVEGTASWKVDEKKESCVLSISKKNAEETAGLSFSINQVDSKLRSSK